MAARNPSIARLSGSAGTAVALEHGEALVVVFARGFFETGMVYSSWRRYRAAASPSATDSWGAAPLAATLRPSRPGALITRSMLGNGHGWSPPTRPEKGHRRGGADFRLYYPSATSLLHVVKSDIIFAGMS